MKRSEIYQMMCKSQYISILISDRSLANQYSLKNDSRRSGWCVEIQYLFSYHANSSHSNFLAYSCFYISFFFEKLIYEETIK